MFFCNDSKALVEAASTQKPAKKKPPLKAIPVFATCVICDLQAILCTDTGAGASPRAAAASIVPDLREVCLRAEDDAIKSYASASGTGGGGGGRSTSGDGGGSSAYASRTPLVTFITPSAARPPRSPPSSTRFKAKQKPRRNTVVATEEVLPKDDNDNDAVTHEEVEVHIEHMRTALAPPKKRRRRKHRAEADAIMATVTTLDERLASVEVRRAQRKAALARTPAEAWTLEQDLRSTIRALERTNADCVHQAEELRARICDLMEQLRDGDELESKLAATVTAQTTQLTVLQAQLAQRQTRSYHSAAAAFDVMEAMWVQLNTTLPLETLDEIIRSYCNKYIVAALNINLPTAFRATVSADRARTEQPPTVADIPEMACAFHYRKHLGSPVLPVATFTDACVYVAALDKAHAAKRYPVS